MHFQNEEDILRPVASCMPLTTQMNMAAIPLDLLNSLTESVRELRKDVFQLRNENQELRQKLAFVSSGLSTLQQNCGMRFPKFGSLPPEIRRIIWEAACRAPQIHILSDYRSSSSRIKYLMRSCREAMEVAKSLHLDYYICNYERGHPVKQRTGKVKNYVNLDVDTVWLHQRSRSVLLPDDVEFLYGKCNKNCEHIPCGEECLSGWRCPDGPKFIRRLAINFEAWIDPCGTRDMGSLEAVWAHDVEELLLVVGEVKPFLRERDFIFVAPTVVPRALGRRYPTFERIERILFSSNWAELEKSTVDLMVQYKAERAEHRKAMIDSGEYTLDEINDGDCTKDLSEWKIPSVKFVEAIQAPDQWTLPPKHESSAIIR